MAVEKQDVDKVVSVLWAVVDYYEQTGVDHLQRELTRQAASLIESLQTQLDESQAELTQYKACGLTPGEAVDVAAREDNVQEALENMETHIDTLKSQLAASLHRYQAAVADLKHGNNCEICRHYNSAPPDCDCECLVCTRSCVCKNCRDEDRWEWRGPVEAVAEAPEIDAVPVARGEWVLQGENEHDYETSLEEKCSLCGRYVYRYDTQPQDNYCPNCGAKMGEGDKQ